MIEISKKAPDFELLDKDGNKHKLSDYLGKKVILYFYPKDNTPGCTKEACEFRDNIKVVTDKNAVIIGISKDSEKSHEKFITKFDLPFLLLSDVEKEVCNLYGVIKDKSMYGKIYKGIERSTFVIDEKGNLEKIYRKVKVTGHVDEVIKKL